MASSTRMRKLHWHTYLVEINKFVTTLDKIKYTDCAQVTSRSCFSRRKGETEVVWREGKVSCIKLSCVRRPGATTTQEENKLNFLNFDAKLDYYIFAARARGKAIEATQRAA
jgi:hypothetical protein